MRPLSRTSIAVAAASLRDCDAILDVRSPAEFAEDHVPGALSCPVLDNEERVRIGTLYKQVSPFEAKKLGAALVARNIAKHLESSFADKPKGWKPLVYCWRGGKRSGAMAHILREVGWEAKILEGGYKAYRRHVVTSLAALPANYSFQVIHGVTGSGKSRLLRSLHAAGAQVLDLEDLAAHRGSVLGNLPERPQPSQKMFESLLLQSLVALDSSREIFIEGESRKIGQLQIPEALIERMRASECLHLQTDIATRIALLLDEYRHFFADPATLGAQLDCLVAMHGSEKVGVWKALAAAGEWPSVVARLLQEHYDPAYLRSAARNFPRLAVAPVYPLDSAEQVAFDRLARSIVQQRHAAVGSALQSC
ncbi:MAG: tRNA 2-selenouridine(34) synthase MnmH [Betaproteobacteria bacterium]|nr:tRNA 2-selenouridine(34) synthase MnmH [Betaproteobacteria bacterium]MSQ88555.1 tRNA 2-selenouridine(34) synthase MnmH [Betaproteobacteria bacterium]